MELHLLIQYTPCTILPFSLILGALDLIVKPLFPAALFQDLPLRPREDGPLDEAAGGAEGLRQREVQEPRGEGEVREHSHRMRICTVVCA